MRRSPKSGLHFAGITAALIIAPGLARAEPPSREPAFQPSPKRFEWLAPIGPYWPENALRQGRGGAVVVDCVVKPDSRLSDCRLIDETVKGLSFADAVLVMAKRNHMAAGPAPADVAEPTDHIWRLRVEFPAHVYAFIKLPADPGAIRGGP